jgi:non-homologous end joining protein Ku
MYLYLKKLWHYRINFGLITLKVKLKYSTTHTQAQHHQ